MWRITTTWKQAARAVCTLLAAIALAGCPVPPDVRPGEEVVPTRILLIADDGEVIASEPERLAVKGWQIEHAVSRPDPRTVEVTTVGDGVLSREAIRWAALSKAAQVGRDAGARYLIVKSETYMTYCFYKYNKRRSDWRLANPVADSAAYTDFRPRTFGEPVVKLIAGFADRPGDGGKNHPVDDTVVSADEKFERLRGFEGVRSKEVRANVAQNNAICRDFANAAGVPLQRW